MKLAIFGGGQLARMMTHAAKPLEIEVVFACEKSDDTSPVNGLGEVCLYDDEANAEALYQALGRPDVITVEKEDVNAELLRQLQGFCRVSPNPDSLLIIQNRGREKQFIRDLGIPTADYVVAESREQILAAIEQLGYPVIIKSVEQGYDGQNQWRIHEHADVDKIPADAIKQQVVVEQWVRFDREVSLIASRSLKGDMKFYALTDNVHQDGILLTSIAPANNADQLQSMAQDYLQRIAERLDYVGVITMECFVVQDKLLINELAPRVHNSGHWTMDLPLVSQFENHVRAVCGHELGDTRLTGAAGMLNLLGVSQPFSLLPCGKLHWYQKSKKPRRKMGHINVFDSDAESVQEKLNKLQQFCYSSDKPVVQKEAV